MMKVTSKEFITKVQEVEGELVSKLDLEGKRESTVEKLKTEAHMQAIFLAIEQLVSTGEEIKTEIGTFGKKNIKPRRIAARTMIHPVTKKPIEIQEGMTKEKDVLGFKTKVEF